MPALHPEFRISCRVVGILVMPHMQIAESPEVVAEHPAMQRADHIVEPALALHAAGDRPMARLVQHRGARMNAEKSENATHPDRDDPRQRKFERSEIGDDDDRGRNGRRPDDPAHLFFHDPRGGRNVGPRRRLEDVAHWAATMSKSRKACPARNGRSPAGIPALGPISRVFRVKLRRSPLY